MVATAHDDATQHWLEKSRRFRTEDGLSKHQGRHENAIGPNFAQVSSYMQMVLLGILLILAVIFDQLRYRMIMSGA